MRQDVLALAQGPNTHELAPRGVFDREPASVRPIEADAGSLNLEVRSSHACHR
jgi:hypothetical protein